jgi:hypothetical protein
MWSLCDGWCPWHAQRFEDHLLPRPAIAMSMAAALASLLRERQFIHEDESEVLTAPLSDARRTMG